MSVDVGCAIGRLSLLSIGGPGSPRSDSLSAVPIRTLVNGWDSGARIVDESQDAVSSSSSSLSSSSRWEIDGIGCCAESPTRS
jgi:hypothetical protein